MKVRKEVLQMAKTKLNHDMMAHVKFSSATSVEVKINDLTTLEEFIFVVNFRDSKIMKCSSQTTTVAQEPGTVSSDMTEEVTQDD